MDTKALSRWDSVLSFLSLSIQEYRVLTGLQLKDAPHIAHHICAQLVHVGFRHAGV